MTANIGPKGETYEYYSACGPILSGEYPEASLYYEAGKLGELGEGCPAEACVIAGHLEFGALWEQNFAIGLVWFTLISSLMLWVYYTWATFQATCGWEEFYVVNMESMHLHLLAWTANFARFNLCLSIFEWVRSDSANDKQSKLLSEHSEHTCVASLAVLLVMCLSGVALKVLIELKLEFESPAMIYQVNGQTAPWIRYAEWLLTCPVRSL